jgi:hypothetical protein
VCLSFVLTSLKNWRLRQVLLTYGDQNMRFDMPLRFYRPFSAGRHLRMNLSRGGVSYSFGGRGLWLTVGPGHSRTSVGVPSTGLYWYQQRRFPPPANDDVNLLSLLPRPHRYDWLAVIGIAVGILTTLAMIWR